jgi:hypothetical protein
MRKDVLIAVLAIVLLGAATVSAKARSQSCSAGEFVNGLLEDGSIDCSIPVDIDTDTNADTLCAGADVYLDGEGSCNYVVDTDTQLSEGQVDAFVADNGYLTSELDPNVLASVKDGVDWTELTGIPADIDDGDDDTNTNAETICAAGEYLDGDGTCKPANVITSPNGDFSISVTNAGIVLSGPASEIELNNAGDVIINGLIIEMDASAQIDMDAALITLN